MEWLIQILKVFADFIPRPVLVTPDQRIVIFLLGRWGINLPPFLYIIWPVLWTADVVQVNERCVESQVVIEGSKSRFEVIYEVIDAYAAVTVCPDVEERVQAEVNGHIFSRRGGIDLEALNESCHQLGVHVLGVMQSESGILTIDING